MDRTKTARFLWVFIKIFILLFVLNLIIPLVVDQALHLLNNSSAPGRDSIIVFKDLIEKHEAIGRFLKVLKIITSFI
ncbi:MAG: hypothetical protein VB106_09795 [Clostridiaceae bacterium]|jgi:hypothetical protein|nr:hypothetical protein [Clostridiaceae bacterium]